MAQTLRILLLVATFAAPAWQGDVFEQVTQESQGVIVDAIIPNTDIRQCSCGEQRVCAEEMKQQALSCFSPCWNQFNKLTNRPEELKKCFDAKNDLLQAFLTCFENNVDSCVESQEGPRIQKANISEIFRLGEKAIAHKADSIANNIASALRRILDTAGSFAICVKDCFLEKNRDGFCFDRYNCQPLLLERKAKRTLRRCTRSINWKKEVGELCTCSVDAGIVDLKDYCSVFQLMASRDRSPKTRNS